MNEILVLGICMFAGLLGGKLVKQFKLPSVTGYLLAGLLIGPSLLNIVSHDMLNNLDFISEVALGFIAFSIGCEFKWSYFKRVGITPIVIAICEALGATLLVSVALIVLGFDFELSILLGAIASATAPAATLMVIKQYKAKGPVTETLMSVVAIDDAVALIAFGFAAAIVNQQNGGSSSLLVSLMQPLREVGVSLILGIACGILFLIPLKYYSNRGNRTTILVASIFVTISLATMFHASQLLTCMAMGAAFINLSTNNDDIFKFYDNITPPLLLLFFVTSGAELNLSVIPTVGLVGITYILVRVAGKYFGAALGAKLSKAEPVVAKYIGWALVPQAGVAIGLSILSAKMVPQYSQTITAVVLCATFIYEIFGPSITKKALQGAKEIESHL